MLPQPVVLLVEPWQLSSSGAMYSILKMKIALSGISAGIPLCLSTLRSFRNTPVTKFIEIHTIMLLAARKYPFNSVSNGKSWFSKRDPMNVLKWTRGFFEMLSDEINLDFLYYQKRNEVLAMWKGIC